MSGRYSTSNPFGVVFGVLVIVLIGIVIVGIGGVVYFQLYPEITTANQRIQQSIQTQTQTQGGTTPLESILKTSSEDERKVLKVLMSHEGKYLQKYIRKEAGLSRLKTHRVLAHLAERGIVTLEELGNTNQVRIADWVKKT